MTTAAEQTGLPQDKLSEIVGHIGGEGALGRFASLLHAGRRRRVDPRRLLQARFSSALPGRRRPCAVVMFRTATVWTAAPMLAGSQVPREERMKKIVFALTALSLVAGSAPSLAAPCKDAKGKFVKCPAAKPKVCRNAQGHFIKCPAAKPKLCRNAQGHFATCK